MISGLTSMEVELIARVTESYNTSKPPKIEHNIRKVLSLSTTDENNETNKIEFNWLYIVNNIK